MNIIVISHRIPYPANKGEKIRTFHQLKYLKEQGHNVSILAPYEVDSELEYFATLEKKYAIPTEGVKLGNKMVRLLMGLLTGKSLSVTNFYSRQLQQKVDEHVKNNQIDAILCSASSMAEYIFKSSVIHTQSNALIMDFMDLDSDKWRQYAERSKFPMNLIYWREAKLVAKYERKIAERFDANFFITDTETNLFKKTCPKADNIFSIENGLDTNTFKPSLQEKHIQTPVLLFTGVMDYAPNVDAVIWFVDNVWQSVISHWPDAQFYIAGMNPNEKVQALKKMDGIHVTGFVEDILPYFDKATIFVAPFRIARGVQNKVLQAFACGIPVISTDMGAEGIRCQDGESILHANSPSDFIEHITTLTQNQATYNQLSDKALGIIRQHYSWDGMLQPFELIIKNAVESRQQLNEHKSV
jgi:sugar transferase (PEP-CTERM/EpsH1 system associated)